MDWNHQIQRRARELWERAGRPQGRDLEFWLQAERDYRRGFQPKLHLFDVIEKRD